MRATATAIPAAADTKFCTVRPIIWVTYFMVLSPAYACQLVLVTKLTAVLKAVSERTPPTPEGPPGRTPWMRWMRYRSRKLAALKASTLSAYFFQLISFFGSIPERR